MNSIENFGYSILCGYLQIHEILWGKKLSSFEIYQKLGIDKLDDVLNDNNDEVDAHSMPSNEETLLVTKYCLSLL